MRSEDNNGDGITKPLSNPKKDKKTGKGGKKPEMVKVADAVYQTNTSISGAFVNNIAFPLSYGSADL